MSVIIDTKLHLWSLSTTHCSMSVPAHMPTLFYGSKVSLTPHDYGNNSSGSGLVHIQPPWFFPYWWMQRSSTVTKRFLIGKQTKIELRNTLSPSLKLPIFVCSVSYLFIQWVILTFTLFLLISKVFCFTVKIQSTHNFLNSIKVFLWK